MPFKGTDRGAYARAGREGKTKKQRAKLYQKYKWKSSSKPKQSTPRSSFGGISDFKPRPRPQQRPAPPRSKPRPQVASPQLQKLNQCQVIRQN